MLTVCEIQERLDPVIMYIFLVSKDNPTESSESAQSTSKSTQPKEKERKVSNFKKGIEIICDKFSRSNKNEMEW